MFRTSAREQVRAGFRTAGSWLLAMAWLGLVFAGMAITFTPSPHTPLVGWVLLAIAAIIFLCTIDRWVVTFSALLAYGVIGGIYMISTGHAVNQPSVQVSLSEAISVTLILALSALVSFTFSKRNLRVLDRIALLIFVVCFFGQALVPDLALVAFGIGLGGLVAAWAYDRFRRSHGPLRV
jgi:hypothetical protein